MFLLVLILLEQHYNWLQPVVALALFLSPTPVGFFGQSQPVRTSSLSVHYLSSTACYLFQERNVLDENSVLLFILHDSLGDTLQWVRSGKADRMKFRTTAIGSDSAMKRLLRQSYGSNKSSIKTSLSTMLWCIPSATPKVVTKVLTKDFRVFVFSLKIAIRRRNVCS